MLLGYCMHPHAHMAKNHTAKLSKKIRINFKIIIPYYNPAPSKSSVDDR